MRDGISEDEFVTMRTERDAQLDMPVLILPSVQVNMRAGAMPPVYWGAMLKGREWMLKHDRVKPESLG